MTQPLEVCYIHFLKLFCPFVDYSLKIGEVARVASVHIRTCDDEIGGRAVVSHRYVVYLGDTQKRLDIGIVRLSGERVGEENDDIYFSVNYSCAYLLVAAERTAVKSPHGKSRSLGNHFCRGTRTAEEMMLEYFTVFGTPIYKLLLFVIVRYECYIFLRLHNKFEGIVVVHFFHRPSYIFYPA